MPHDPLDRSRLAADRGVPGRICGVIGRLIAASYLFRRSQSAAAVLAPWPLKLLIDHVIFRGNTAAPGIGRETLAGRDADAGILCAHDCSPRSRTPLEKNPSATIRERLTLELRDRVLAHLLTLSPRLRATHRSGELVLRIVDDTDLFARVLTKTLPQIFHHSLTLVATFAALMLWLQPGVAPSARSGCHRRPMLLRRDGRRLWKASSEKRAREGQVSARRRRSSAAMAVIQASGDERPTRDAFAGVNRSARDTPGGAKPRSRSISSAGSRSCRALVDGGGDGRWRVAGAAPSHDRWRPDAADGLRQPTGQAD